MALEPLLRSHHHIPFPGMEDRVGSGKAVAWLTGIGAKGNSGVAG